MLPFYEEDNSYNPFDKYIEKETDPVFGNIDLYDESNNQPSFMRYRTNYSIDRLSITDFTISNGIGVLCVDNSRLHVINYTTPDHPLKIAEFDGTLNGSRINNLFLDPTGKYLITLHDNKECQWITLETKKSFAFNKTPNVTFSFICWNKLELESVSVTSIIIGTEEGALFEYQPNPERSDFYQKSQKDLVKIFDFASVVEKSKISLYRITGTSMMYNSTLGLLGIMIATPHHLALFTGIVSNKFPCFQKICDINKKFYFTELFAAKPTGNLFVYPPTKETLGQFVWMNNNSIIHGNIEIDSNLNYYNVSKKKVLKVSSDIDDSPLSMVLTKYHCIVLYYSRFVVVNVINDEIVCYDSVGTNFGIAKGLAYDVALNATWYYTSSNIFTCQMKKEDVRIWRILTDANRYDEALRITEDNKKNNDLVRQSFAEHKYKQKDYMASAALFAETYASFESSILKFLTLESKEPLLEYLFIKLNMFNEKDTIQVNILNLWYIDTSLANLVLIANTDAALYDKLNTNLKSFLKLPKTLNSIDKHRPAYYNLIDQYGNCEILIYVAELLSDYEKIIMYYLFNEKYEEALSILVKQNHDSNLWYKISHELFSIMPHKMVDYWTQMSKILDQKQILFNIMHQNFEINSDVLSALIRYLRYCTETLKLEDPFIHNYLVTMYCISKDSESVLKYLEDYKNNPFYDAHYILRLCFQYKIFRGCTFILCSMELWDEAVLLALTIDENHAKECANKPKEKAIRRRLWLKIAHATVGDRMDVERAQKFMAEAQVLKFEDILPFFADFNKIDTFKTAICESLKTYGDAVAAQKLEIDKLSKISDRIMKENSEVGQRSTHIAKYTNCSLCDTNVFIKPFYTFPCTHSFHQSCYIKYYFEMSALRQKKQIFDLLYKITDGYLDSKISLKILESGDCESQKIFEILVSTYEGMASTNFAVIKDKQKIKAMIDDEMAMECIFCGDFSIRNIDQPLFRGIGFLEL